MSISDEPLDMKLTCRLKQGSGPLRFTPESILDELGLALTEKAGKDAGSALRLPLAFTRMGELRRYEDHAHFGYDSRYTQY